MKMRIRLLALLLLVSLTAGCLAGCQPANPQNQTTQPSASVQVVDYVAQLKLDMNSETLKQEVTVKSYVDGDTTHFFVPTSVNEHGVLKARYLAVNTPESTGKIEQWGKKASAFTKEKLQSATSIYIESDDGNWNLDSTGERNLVWVWYKPAGSDEYRNLNLELLQNGLAIASSASENRYGDSCTAALAQAQQQKLHVFSKEKDPDFYYGDAIPVTLKGLRTNIELYENLKVVFEGVITRESSQTVYVEDYDAETDMYYGITVYYGWNLTGTGLEMMKVGNRVKFVGTVQYYAAGDSWQVSDLNYRDMRPNDPNNIQFVSDGHTASNKLTDPKTFAGANVDIEVLETLEGEDTKMESFRYAELVLGTSVQMKNLKVVDIYTTSNEDSSSKGAMTLTCEVDGVKISVRTVVLYDENGKLITKDAYLGKTIDVTGIVDCFSGTYQIKVFTPNDIVIVG